MRSSVDEDHVRKKDLLSTEKRHLSIFKDNYPSDSEDDDAIGHSSDEEAEGLEPLKGVARKKKSVPGGVPPPRQPPPDDDNNNDNGNNDPDNGGPPAPVPPQPQPEPEPEPEPVRVLAPGESAVNTQAFNALIAQVAELNRRVAAATGAPVPGLSSPPGGGAVPFSLPKARAGEKKCSYCHRTFWSTDTLRKHQKTHTGSQKWDCDRCGRKMASKTTLLKHLETCQQPKTMRCRHRGCGKKFATKAMLKAHSTLHTKEKETVCKCGKTFSRNKSYKEHWVDCAQNPDRRGPYPCPVPGCHRGPAHPFNRTRNLNQHIKNEHGHDPKHK